MKVLLLIDAWFPFVGGAQVQIKNLQNILASKYSCSYKILHSSSVNIFMRFLWAFWVIPQAYIMHRRYRFDIIHCHAYWAGIPGRILGIILNLPVVFTVHGSNLMDIKSHSLKALLEKIILTKIHYDAIISVSSNFLNYPNVNKNIFIIPNGVSTELFDKIRISKAPPYKIIFVGRNDPIKGLKYLQAAMKLVDLKIPQAKLVVITSSYDEKELIKEYKSSHLFVLPSLSEGQPLTLLEAWAAKLPVIVTAVGENPKMIRHGYNGYMVKPTSIQELASTIIKALKDYPKSCTLGERGYDLVKTNYSWTMVARRTYEIYQFAVKK
jgi:glycosyltransferase involved in cell wall biosynthesis